MTTCRSESFQDLVWTRELGHKISETFPPVDGLWASLVAQSVKNLPAVQETWIQSLDHEYPLEKERRK